MKKTLGSLSIEEKTYYNMIAAIKKYNEDNLFPVNQAAFRKMALELLSQLILQNEPIPLKLVEN